MKPALIGASLIVTALFQSAPAAAQDGKSIVTKALNNNWVWTYTPTAK